MIRFIMMLMLSTNCYAELSRFNSGDCVRAHSSFNVKIKEIVGVYYVVVPVTCNLLNRYACEGTVYSIKSIDDDGVKIECKQ